MLLIDIGHTRVKYARYVSKARIENVVSLPVQDFTKVLPEEVAIVSCVDGEVQKRLKGQRNFEFISASDIPFPSRYDLSLLGVDRLLACMASVEILGFKNTYIVDAGSFVTIDIVRDGVHCGGAIFPGIRGLFDLARAVLGRDVFYEAVDGIDYAISTDRAVNFAITRMFDFIKGDNLSVVLTGGDACLLEGLLCYLKKEYVLERDLVLLGMSCIVEYLI